LRERKPSATNPYAGTLIPSRRTLGFGATQTRRP
jgi:hypothetical protein